MGTIAFSFLCDPCPAYFRFFILTEMTAKYGTYFYFLCQQKGGGILPLGAEWGGGGPDLRDIPLCHCWLINEEYAMPSPELAIQSLCV